MKAKTKRYISLFLALVFCFSLLGTLPAFAATTVQAYMVNYPRQSDPNYGDSRFGHSANYLMSGWAYVSYERMTLHAIGSYNGQIAYCIEPGVDQDSGDTLTSTDESYWDNYPASGNVTIPPETIKTLLGRVLTYGYHGNISQSWVTNNPSDSDSLSYAIATQMLVWEVVVGERDANFDHVDPSVHGAGAVMDYIGASNPLRSQIMSYYNQIIENIKTHNVMPSFCAPLRDYARAYELEQDGSEYTLTLTDSNGVLDNYAFSADVPGVSFSKSGNRLTILSDERYPVEFAYAGQDTPLVNVAVNDGEAIVNEIKYGSVSGMKLDENGKALPGAVFGLFRSDAAEFTEESALLTATSGEDGVFVFENLPIGDYIVRELTAPAGYVLSEELHQVSIAEDAQIIELEVTNDPIRGSITLTKYDADYPDNRLIGAVFEVYRDVNGDKVPDDGDDLLGEMDDEGEGVYWMRELDAGGYLVREAEAPEGYVLDENAYYVEITTDGEVCVVENEADVGFVNQPLRGALKIVKTTDDGRVEGYEIAEPVTVTLVANETLTVNVHNNKITVDVPRPATTA